ncbi:hypothetical protein KJ782_07135 [Patescibacteria group bacterium]|nr:hypothetical protein [Patescibacteria group bacterium]
MGNQFSYAQRTLRLAVESFKDHQIVSRDDIGGRWAIARRDADGRIRGDYYTEIISLHRGRLFVGGDIDDCTFGYYSSGKDEDPRKLHRDKVRWIGETNDIPYYVRQKAAIGMTDGYRLTTEYDAATARQQIQERIDCAKDDENLRNIYQDALDYTDSSEALQEYFSDHPDIREAFGDVTSSRVIFAWAACNRLCLLFKEDAV